MKTKSHRQTDPIFALRTLAAVACLILCSSLFSMNTVSAQALHLSDNQFNVVEIHLTDSGFFGFVNGTYFSTLNYLEGPGICGGLGKLEAVVRGGDSGTDLRIYGYTSLSVAVGFNGSDQQDFVTNFTQTPLFARAYGGNDVLIGGGANDHLYGDDGDDELFGGNGYDRLQGGNGHDEIHGGAGNDNLRGGFGMDMIFGDAGDDIIHGCGVAMPYNANMWGDSFKSKTDFLPDFLVGGTGSDQFRSRRYYFYSFLQGTYSLMDTDIVNDFTKLDSETISVLVQP